MHLVHVYSDKNSGCNRKKTFSTLFHLPFVIFNVALVSIILTEFLLQLAKSSLKVGIQDRPHRIITEAVLPIIRPAMWWRLPQRIPVTGMPPEWCIRRPPDSNIHPIMPPSLHLIIRYLLALIICIIHFFPRPDLIWWKFLRKTFYFWTN